MIQFVCCVLSHSVVSDSCATPWTLATHAARLALVSMEFSRQEYWSGLPFPPPGDLPDPGIIPVFPALASRLFTTEPPGKPPTYYIPIVYFVKFWKYKNKRGIVSVFKVPLV